MTLKEIEKLAEYQVSGDASADSHVKQLLRADKLARMLLRVLPVVRAAVRWRDCDEDPAATECSHDDLADSVDQMRREMEE